MKIGKEVFITPLAFFCVDNRKNLEHKSFLSAPREAWLVLPAPKKRIFNESG